MNRRRFVASSLALITLVALGAGCKKEERCPRCGMRVERGSPWRVELVAASGALVAFDTPRCALNAWKRGQVEAQSMRVHEYYDQRVRDAGEVRFVVGGDVTGPMGPDFVPVDPPRVTKFIQDHGAEQAFRLDEITPQVLDQF
jgi:hypothetical protein